MSNNTPPEKKRKTLGGTAISSSWREKSIDKFNLQPVPNKWKDSVAIGSEDAWKRYYNYRVDKEKDDARNISSFSNYNSDGDSIDDYEMKNHDDVLQSLMWSWTDSSFNGMGEMTKRRMLNELEWQWTPLKPKLELEEEDKIRSVDYYSYVWSPYAIPHAIKLTHSWYGQAKYYSYDMATDWNYFLLDFEEDVEQLKLKYTEVCSNHYDVIKTTNLTKATCNKIRKHLYGANNKEVKKVTCSDTNLWILLFGSMGSTDDNLMEDAKDCSLGYSWCPWEDEKMKQMLFDAKAPANDDPNGDPPTDLNRYNPRWCSWLRHRILEVTDSLGPISKHYQPPPLRATGSYSEDEYNGY